MEKYAIPINGKLCRFPGQPKLFLPKNGGFVPWTGPRGRYWRRRLKEGSIKVFDKSPTFDAPTKFGTSIRKKEVNHD